VRIVMPTTSYPASPHDFRGCFVADMAKGLVLRGHDVTVVAPSPGAHVPEIVVEGNLRLRRPAPSGNPAVTLFGRHGVMETLRQEPGRLLEIPAALTAMRKVIREEGTGADWILSNWLLPSGLIAGNIARQLGIRHGVIEHGGSVRILRRLPPFLVGQLVTQSKIDAIQFVSEELRRTTLELLPKGQVQHLTERSFAMPAPISPLKLAAAPNKEGNHCLVVGRLNRSKGIHRLLEAFASLPQGSLTIVGDGPDGAQLKSQATSLGLSSRVSFVGAVSPAEVTTMMQTHDLLVVPSLDSRQGSLEGTPRVILEAFRAEICVVASRTGGIPELVEHQRNGWLTTPGSASELRHGMATLLGDPNLRRKLAQAGKEGVPHYSVDAWVDAWNKFLL